jgi:hypothetical protein
LICDVVIFTRVGFNLLGPDPQNIFPIAAPVEPKPTVAAGA